MDPVALLRAQLEGVPAAGPLTSAGELNAAVAQLGGLQAMCGAMAPVCAATPAGAAALEQVAAAVRERRERAETLLTERTRALEDPALAAAWRRGGWQEEGELFAYERARAAVASHVSLTYAVR